MVSWAILVGERDLGKVDKILKAMGYIQGIFKNGEIIPATKKEILFARLNTYETFPYSQFALEVGIMQEKSLSERQKEILAEIIKFKKENGFSFTVRELCKLVGLKSTSSMAAQLSKRYS